MRWQSVSAVQHVIKARMYALHTRTGSYEDYRTNTDWKQRLKEDLKTAWIYPKQ